MTVTTPLTDLTLPERTSKPRLRGRTMVIDNGVPTRRLEDVVDSFGQYVDLVKFGWGTALVTADLDRKISILRANDIDFYFGGTLFEKHVEQRRVDGFRAFCRGHGCRYVEISNGTIPMTAEQKAGYIDSFADDFLVLAEVGFKDPARSRALEPREWVQAVCADLDAGAQTVILEARESGRSGIGQADGTPRTPVIETLLRAVDPGRLLFEAPTKALQTYLVERLGANVNLGNIAADDVVGVETLRLGLRSDTLLTAHA